MKQVFLLLILIFGAAFWGCHASFLSSSQIPVLTDYRQLDAHIGKVATIRGVVSNTKIPQIEGVDVLSDDPDLRGKLAEATGILERWTVTAEQLEADLKKYGMFAHRGPGTFYRLKKIRLNDNAQVRPLCSHNWPR